MPADTCVLDTNPWPAAAVLAACVAFALGFGAGRGTAAHDVHACVSTDPDSITVERAAIGFEGDEFIPTDRGVKHHVSQVFAITP